MIRNLLLSAALVAIAPLSATAASFYDFAIDWSAVGTDFSLAGTTAPGENTPGTYDVTSALSFLTDTGTGFLDQGFVLYSGNVQFLNSSFVPNATSVQVAIDAGGNASFVAPFTWAPTPGWYTSDSGPQTAYRLGTGGFFVHTQGVEETSGVYVPSNASNVTTYISTSAAPQGVNNISGTASVIPLPAALPLLATALFGLGVLGWRRRAA